ncbi:alpha/beta fold hydrolase [Hwanghaeella sp.]|uniref:alpha/beta fold hydrolase n=1 Tax=Hwanghaeella sp. TaxID=2605943 RepID=UPI003CCC1399
MMASGPFALASAFPESKWPAMQAITAQSEMADLVASIDEEFRGQLGRMLDGILAYHHHDYRRDLSDPPAIWRRGSTSLHRFAPPETGKPVLIVPSLVNKSYILDLNSRGSFCRTLADKGMVPYLVDWGEPGTEETDFGLTDYVNRLSEMLAAVEEEHGPDVQVSMVGYCMGGLLALPLAIQRQDRIGKLILMAMPWDFHSSKAPGPNASQMLVNACEPVLSLFGRLPVDCVQAMFAAIDPLNAFRKFQYFARLDPASGKARQFVALEDWLNDGVSLTAAVARETLGGWYAENRTSALNWQVGGQTVNPADYHGETLVVIPKSDRIVPPESALAVTELLEDVRLLRPALGHIGMMSGRRAVELWDRVVRFLDA